MKRDTVIISIHPAFIAKMISGEKLYEYRKHFQENIRYMLVYATSPVQKIIAVIEVESVLKGSPCFIWNITRNRAGVTKEFYDAYFKGKTDAYAIKIKKIHTLEPALLITEIEGVKTIPQSYIYLKENNEKILDILQI